MSTEGVVSLHDEISRENVCHFVSPNVIDFSPVASSLVTTPGQEQSGKVWWVRSTENPDEWTLSVNCGRKKSSSVAQKFVNACGGIGHLFSPEAPGLLIEDLNFYLAVDITFRDSFADSAQRVYFAQGRNGTSNNWWVGGENVNHNGNNAFLFVVYSNVNSMHSKTYNISGGTENIIIS